MHPLCWCLGVLVLVVAAVFAGRWANASVTVYLVRHAEKEAHSAPDPGLTAIGERRANALAQVLARAGLDAIYTSNLRRTRQTAAEVARSQGLAPVEIAITAPASSTSFVTELRTRLRARHWGERVLVVSHSNTVPMLAEALGVPMGPIDETTGYDHLFVVTVPRFGEPRLLAARFGPPPPPPGRPRTAQR